MSDKICIVRSLGNGMVIHETVLRDSEEGKAALANGPSLLFQTLADILSRRTIEACKLPPNPE